MYTSASQASASGRWGCYQFPEQQVGDNFESVAPTLADRLFYITLLNFSRNLKIYVNRSKVIYIDDVVLSSSFVKELSCLLSATFFF